MIQKKSVKRLTLKKKTISNLNATTMIRVMAGAGPGNEDTEGPTVCAPSCITRCEISCGPISYCICPDTYYC